MSTIKGGGGVIFVNLKFCIEKAKDSLLVGGTEIDDANWYKTKELLRKSFKGRSVVQWVENNLKTSSKIYKEM